LGPAWAITSLGGLIAPVSFLFNWLITVILFGLAALLITGFRLKNGLFSAILGAVVYSLISAFVLRALGLVDVEATRAALSMIGS
jgi:putative membrane protein